MTPFNPQSLFNPAFYDSEYSSFFGQMQQNDVVSHFKTRLKTISSRVLVFGNIENDLHFIKQELRVKYEMTGTAQRREIYEFPLDAIREAFINAVVHRDYFLSGSHTTIEVFDDRIEISNPGGLPKGLDEKSFGKRAVRRNKIVERTSMTENEDLAFSLISFCLLLCFLFSEYTAVKHDVRF